MPEYFCEEPFARKLAEQEPLDPSSEGRLLLGDALDEERAGAVSFPVLLRAVQDGARHRRSVQTLLPRCFPLP